MPDTVIDRVNKLAYNEPDKFIFTDLRGHPVVDINITGVHMYAADININQSPQDPPHRFHSIEEAEKEPSIPYPNIDLNINHETPSEQV